MSLISPKYSKPNPNQQALADEFWKWYDNWSSTYEHFDLYAEEDPDGYQDLLERKITAMQVELSKYNPELRLIFNYSSQPKRCELIITATSRKEHFASVDFLLQHKLPKILEEWEDNVWVFTALKPPLPSAIIRIDFRMEGETEHTLLDSREILCQAIVEDGNRLLTLTAFYDIPSVNHGPAYVQITETFLENLLGERSSCLDFENVTVADTNQQDIPDDAFPLSELPDFMNKWHIRMSN